MALSSSSSSVSPFWFHPAPSKSKGRTSLTAVSALDAPTMAAIGGGSVAAVAAVLSLTGPERRAQGGGDDSDKEVVREYFNKQGLETWKKIYGESEDVNSVQRDIRLGHSKTVESVMMMLTDEGSLTGLTICDAGCGTGCLAIPLATQGALVSAADISASMVNEAAKQAKQKLPPGTVMPKFEVSDLESLSGKYETVVCVDVLMNYPQNRVDAMISHLASLAQNRLILTFAPNTLYYSFLKRIGELFPGPRRSKAKAKAKTTRAYLHAEADVERALNKAGWKIRKRGLITTQFYFSQIVEAVPAPHMP